MRNKSSNVKSAESIIPVATTIENSCAIKENLIDGKYNHRYDSSGENITSFKHDGGEDGNHPPSSEYWGRFNDPVAESTTVLPSGSAMDNYMPVATAQLDNRMDRHLLIRRVYLILIVQLFATFGTCAIMTLHEPTRAFVLGEGQPLYILCSILTFVMICALSVYKRSYPMNMILLSVFTLSCAYTIGIVTASYAQAGAEDLVLEAVLVTAVVFIFLTVYTLQSKRDFSFLNAGLGAGLWIMILWGLFAMVFGLKTGWVYAVGGSFLFSGFVIYDTYMLAERYDPQDYVIAAVELYLDIINLFLFILRILSESRNRN